MNARAVVQHLASLALTARLYAHCECPIATPATSVAPRLAGVATVAGSAIVLAACSQRDRVLDAIDAMATAELQVAQQERRGLEAAQQRARLQVAHSTLLCHVAMYTSTASLTKTCTHSHTRDRLPKQLSHRRASSGHGCCGLC